MIKIDKQLVKKVAKTARLELTEAELIKFTKDFKEILSAFSVIDRISTNKVKASLQPVDIKENYREDFIEKSLSQAEALANTKHKTKGYFKGPSST